MATTTATITLSSADLLSDNLSLSATMNLYKGGTTATGLDQMNYHRLVVPTGTNFDLIEESTALTEDANYVYIINKNTDVTDYVKISINAEEIGRLYAGDWMFMPWSQTDVSADVEVYCPAALSTTCAVEYAVFHQGKTFSAA